MRSTIHHHNKYSMAGRNLGSGSSEGEGGPGVAIGAQVLVSVCEDTLSEQRPSLGCTPVHLYSG